MEVLQGLTKEADLKQFLIDLSAFCSLKTVETLLTKQSIIVQHICYLFNPTGCVEGCCFYKAKLKSISH